MSFYKNLFSWVFMLGVYSCVAQDQMYDICPIKVGENTPAGLVYDDQNNAYELNQLMGEKPSVLVFYRGAWCGYCTQHLAELNDLKSDIDSMGFQIFGITVDRPEKLEESYTKSSDEIDVFSDASLSLINAFGLAWTLEDDQYTKYINDYNLDLELWSGKEHHSLPVPAIFVIKDQTIVFQYVNPNYKHRLKPETLMAVLSTL